MNRLICLCNGVRKKEICDALKVIDPQTLESIQEYTGAATNCGKCINTIEAIIEEKQKSK
jgi:bacterioferritin-associated ferredoxin